ncbi:MAG: 4a-hydroxytetrahydrobiopterin dehydratase [Leptolyngbya sp. PLA3]|nr:MAG: 4a-hydroxytetrahydrobiopterin dehydratase [Cyanobacteria bacterium CYA]MCE7968494.1 4a-hydroxytetrahydrobiopterin dehydratase [Leptolyngbya sp. PL-A3]
MSKLSEAEVKASLADVPDWSELDGEIQRTFQFSDFNEAMRFVNRVAERAESLQHHPDILIRYNKVTLTLSTHDAGGITSKDFDLARHADQFASV